MNLHKLVLPVLVAALLLVALFGFRDGDQKQALKANIPPVEVDPPAPHQTAAEDRVEAGTESDEELRKRLFPTTGFLHFATAREVPWAKVLVSEVPWSEQELKTLDMALNLILLTEGKTSDIGKEILATSKGGPVKAVVPMGADIAVGRAPNTMYFEAMWFPPTGSLFASRRVMGSSLMLLTSNLAHEYFHVGQIPTEARARIADKRAIELEAYRYQLSFNGRLESKVEELMKADPVRVARMKRELKAINAEILSRIDAYTKFKIPLGLGGKD